MCISVEVAYTLLIYVQHLILVAAEAKPIQTSSATSTKAFETPVVINLRPPPIDRSKSFDEDDFSPVPIVPPKKINRAPINAKVFTVADLQIATDSFSVENLIGEGSVARVYRAQLDDGKVCTFALNHVIPTHSSLQAWTFHQ